MTNNNLTVENLLDLSKSIAAGLFDGVTYPWEVLPKISEYILSIGERLPRDEYQYKGEGIWISKSADIMTSAYLKGPLIICPGAEIRHCAFIRGSVIIGSGSVIGNSSELKNSIIFDNAQVPHYNYIGDSILGYKAHLGAGAKTSNLKSDKTLVTIMADGEKIDTCLKKFGAIVGDNVEVGCNAILNPGTVIGRNTTVYPLSMVRGYIPGGSIYKKQGEIAEKM